MSTYFEEKGLSANANDIAEFQMIVPNALDVEGFFKMKGCWANEDIFGSVPVSSKSKFCSVFKKFRNYLFVVAEILSSTKLG